MKTWNALFVCLFWCAGSARAADLAAPKVMETPMGADVEKAEAKTEPAKEAPKADKPENRKKEEAKAAEEEGKAAPAAAIPEIVEKPKAKVLTAAESLAAEWKFLGDEAQSADGEIQDGAVEHLKVFVDKRLEAPMRPDALYLLAGLRQKRGDVKGGLVDLLRLVYEYPESKHAMKAKSDFLDGAGRKFSRRLKAAEEELVKTPKSEDKAERLALLCEKLGGSMEDSLYEASVEEIHRFETRFADYAGADKVEFSLAGLHAAGGRSVMALVAYQKLLAVRPDSALRPKAQFAVGAVYADSLKDYKKAIEAFSEVVEKYPGSPEVLASLQRSSQLYSDRLKQYQLAVEVDEKIVKLFPKTDGALAALKDAAKLQRERLKAPGDAIKTDQRLAAMFPTAGVDALREAAAIARKDLKDYKQEVEIRRAIAKSYASAKEAPEELYAAAEVCEDDLKDNEQALSLYKELGTSFPGTKQAKKAAERLAKLDKAAAPVPAPVPAPAPEKP
ncbi:MAG: tetratricopeptide repeat protein [Elusimicrobia bacterium]|nr:tetratricopeptide repeat protein [Elusimicrobiota bacterium]